MEAMAAGLPVVATRTGSLGELVDADCGILLPQRDPELFAGALGRLLDDPALRKRLGQAGRRRVLAKFSTESTTFALAQLLGAVPATAIGPDYRAPIGLRSHGEGNVGALAAWKDAVS
jgi:glycosyltransferase involved in cell wall biosynthesis